MIKREVITMSEITKKEYSIPKKCFDMEYATQWKKEVEYLYSVGIKPTFTKRDKEYGVITYKYAKSAELFGALAAFYNNMALEKQFDEARSIFERPSSSVIVLNVTNAQADVISRLVTADSGFCSMADTINCAAQVAVAVAGE